MTRCSFLALLLVLVTLGMGAFSSPARAQDQSTPSATEGSSKIEVMVLGSVHFANPGQDAINTRVADVTTPKRQAQIRAVVDSLLNFEPTKVAVEWPREDAAKFDSLYHAYQDGRHDLTPNERQQLGFRLANRQGHDHVYPVDRHQPLSDTVLTYAKKHDPSFIRYFRQYRQAVKRRKNSVGEPAPIGDLLRFVNEPDHLKFLYEPYMRMVEVGADSTHVGVGPVATYYERNLHIFANLTAISEPGDRVILIFGAGHAPFLRTFVEGHPSMTLVDPLNYL